jgi:hypothetical protein
MFESYRKAYKSQGAIPTKSLFCIIVFFFNNIYRETFYKLGLKRKRRPWNVYGSYETVYGFHKYGVGVYRIDRVTCKPIEFWLDYQLATTEEVKKYEKYLNDNRWFE